MRVRPKPNFQFGRRKPILTRFEPMSSGARHGCLTGVSGQRPEQGAAANFFAQHKTWAQGPYPAQ